MPSRSDHRDAVARRLELLRVERDAVAADAADDTADVEQGPDDAPWWETAPVIDLAPPADPEPPRVPVPGRHASRRRGALAAGMRDRLACGLPETLRGRVGLGPWQLSVLALVVATGLALTCWWLLRSDPELAPVASTTTAPLVAVSAPVSAGSAPASTASASATGAGTVTVDVAGRVRRPGVLDLPAGSRVVDAIAAAGGARPGTDLSGLNRARLLVDGEQIVVGAPAPAAAGSSGSSGSTGSTGAAAPEALVNLNTATLDQLDALPEVGPVTAQAILEYRTEHGGFGSVDELLDVDGIGEVTLAKIAPHVTV